MYYVILQRNLMDKQNALQLLKQWAIDRGINSQPPNPAAFTVNIVEELAELNEASKKSDWNGMIDAIADIMVFCSSELTQYQLDAEEVLLETHREINSRIGAWSQEYGKWMKDTSPEAKANWYSADYTRLLGKE